jgi:hypothetical protein
MASTARHLKPANAETVEDVLSDMDKRAAQTMLEMSCTESLIDDATQVIQRTPFLCRYPKRLWTAGLISEFAEAIDLLNVKLAELQGADR